MQGVDRRRAAFAHVLHPLVPRLGGFAVAILHRQQRLSDTIHFRDVVPPGLDKGAEAFVSAARRAAGLEPLLDPVQFIKVISRRDQQFRPGREMQINRLARQSCPFGDVGHAHALTRCSVSGKQVQSGLQNAYAGI